MNKDAAFFSSIVIATLAFLSSFYTYAYYGLAGALITFSGGIVWIGLGFYFRNSKGGYSKRDKQNVNRNINNKGKKKKRK